MYGRGMLPRREFETIPFATERTHFIFGMYLEGKKMPGRLYEEKSKKVRTASVPPQDFYSARLRIHEMLHFVKNVGSFRFMDPFRTRTTTTTISRPLLLKTEAVEILKTQAPLNVCVRV